MTMNPTGIAPDAKAVTSGLLIRTFGSAQCATLNIRTRTPPMNDPMPDLLPCPFCGSAFDLTIDGVQLVHPATPCFGRHISIVVTDFRRIAEWNTRTPTPAPNAGAGHAKNCYIGTPPHAGSAAIETTPDPRDEVIARLVGALENMLEI